MTALSAPFPKTVAALQALNSRQLQFCAFILDGEYSTTAYRRAYGRSVSPEKMAYRVKSSTRVRAYLAAVKEERHIRGVFEREAGQMEIIAKHRRQCFDRHDFLSARYAEIRAAQEHELAQRRRAEAAKPRPANVTALPAASRPSGSPVPA